MKRREHIMTLLQRRRHHGHMCGKKGTGMIQPGFAFKPRASSRNLMDQSAQFIVLTWRDFLNCARTTSMVFRWACHMHRITKQHLWSMPSLAYQPSSNSRLWPRQRRWVSPRCLHNRSRPRQHRWANLRCLRNSSHRLEDSQCSLRAHLDFLEQDCSNHLQLLWLMSFRNRLARMPWTQTFLVL